MDSDLYFRSAGKQPLCGNHLIYAQEIVEIGGQLPPGLSRRGLHFEGTPEQPGDWNYRVKVVGLACREERLSYDDQVVNIHFHIEGDAPRKLE
jgi:hypothetical protein